MYALFAADLCIWLPVVLTTKPRVCLSLKLFSVIYSPEGEILAPIVRCESVYFHRLIVTLSELYPFVSLISPEASFIVTIVEAPFSSRAHSIRYQ